MQNLTFVIHIAYVRDKKEGKQFIIKIYRAPKQTNNALQK